MSIRLRTLQLFEVHAANGVGETVGFLVAAGNLEAGYDVARRRLRDRYPGQHVEITAIQQTEPCYLNA